MMLPSFREVVLQMLFAKYIILEVSALIICVKMINLIYKCPSLFHIAT